MRKTISRVMLAGLGLTLSTFVFGQSAYSPGQTFSSGGARTPAPAPANPQYRPVQPVTPPQVRQQAPAARTSAQQPVSKNSGSLYNLPAQGTASASKVKTQGSESTRRASAGETKKSVSSSAPRAAVKPKVTSPEAEDADNKLSAKAEETSENTVSVKPAETEAPAKKAAPSEAPEIASAPESADKLVIFSRKTGKKQIALTYDDGPNPNLTPKLMEYLKENNVPATFFMMGEMVKAHPAMVKALADNGFELANHTYSHPDLRKLSEEKILEQLQDTHDQIKEASGIDVKYMRPPFGAHNSKVDAICKKMGYKIINWSVDTNDWRNRPTSALVNTIMSGASDGAIILMHDRKHAGKETVLEATMQVVPQLRAKGYTFVTVGELLGEAGAPASAPAPAASVSAVEAPATSGTGVVPAPAAPPQASGVSVTPADEIIPAGGQETLPSPAVLP